MKYLIIISFIFCSCYSICQENDSLNIADNSERSSVYGWASNNPLVTVEYGIVKYKLESVNHEMKTNFDKTFSNYLGTVGASFSIPLVINQKFTFDTHLDYMFYHSHPLVIELNDSNRYFIQGFHIGIDACQDLFSKFQNVDLLMGLGFNVGRLNFQNWDVTKDDEFNRKNKYTNPFFSPKISFEPRVILFKFLTLSIRTELQIDVTNKNWKIKNNDLNPIGHSSATGYNIRLTLGWTG